jgi:hypothetical protein
MTTYWSILEKMRGSELRLTKMDNEIYEHFKREFPEFDPKATINEDEMKSNTGKERWRNFIMQYEKKIDDYNFGTLVRSNPSFEYGEKETIFGELFYRSTYEMAGKDVDIHNLFERLSFSYSLLTLLAVVRMQFYAIEIAR